MYDYNLDGSLSSASEIADVSIRYHAYTRLPTALAGAGGRFSIRYDCLGRRLGKVSAETILYRRGMGRGIQPLALRIIDEKIGEMGVSEAIYVFTPAGQSASCELRVASNERGAYARVSRDHLSSLRAEASVDAAVWAMYSLE
jgi:hypothetical protein